MRDPYRDPHGAATTGRSFVTRGPTKRAMHFAHERRLRLNIVTAGTAETDDYLNDLERLATHRALAAEDRVWLMQHRYFVEPTQAHRMADLVLEATTSMSFPWGKGELVRQRIGDGMLEHSSPCAASWTPASTSHAAPTGDRRTSSNTSRWRSSRPTRQAVDGPQPPA